MPAHETKVLNYVTYSWFHTFVLFWMFYSFFWVIPGRLNIMCRRFGTIRLFYLHRRPKQEEFFLFAPTMKMEQRDYFETFVYKIQTQGNHPKEIIQHYIRLYLHQYTIMNRNTILIAWINKISLMICTIITIHGW
jgi:hypothetical protein